MCCVSAAGQHGGAGGCHVNDMGTKAPVDMLSLFRKKIRGKLDNKKCCRNTGGWWWMVVGGGSTLAAGAQGKQSAVLTTAGQSTADSDGGSGHRHDSRTNRAASRCFRRDVGPAAHGTVSPGSGGRAAAPLRSGGGVRCGSGGIRAGGGARCVGHRGRIGSLSCGGGVGARPASAAVVSSDLVRNVCSVQIPSSRSQA